LLGTEGSLLASVAAAGLDGLRGTLRAALGHARADQGADACAALLDALDRLLDGRGQGAPERPVAPPVPPRPTAPPRSVAAPILTLAEELAASAEVDDFAPGAVPSAPDGPGGEDRVRRWYHLTLLRLPERHAAVWRARAAEADPPAQEPWRTLPGWADEVLLPPSGDGRPGVRTVREKATEPADLAELVLALQKHDEALRLLLDRLWTGGSDELTNPQVSGAYRRELTKRLDLLRHSPLDSTERLRASVSVDEAICSVTHLPPGAPGSWWNRLAAESHNTALEMCRRLSAAGRNVEAALPARPYRQARGHTGTEDVRLGIGGRPGETLTCLRLWLRVDDQEFPGRVVYRGQE